MNHLAWGRTCFSRVSSKENLKETCDAPFQLQRPQRWGSDLHSLLNPCTAWELLLCHLFTFAFMQRDGTLGKIRVTFVSVTLRSDTLHTTLCQEVKLPCLEVIATSMPTLICLPDMLVLLWHNLSDTDEGLLICWYTWGPCRKWGEGTTSWWDCDVLQTRAVCGRQRCHRCASQHRYSSNCCHSCHTWGHVFTEHSCTFWFLPLHDKRTRGIWENAAYISARSSTTIFC